MSYFVSGQKAVRNRNHVPKSDGCGSVGFEVASEYLPLVEMTKCCDNHDICYDTCNSGKESCDLEFKRCLYNYCESYKSVNVAGDTITKGISDLHAYITFYFTSFHIFIYIHFIIYAFYC